jgi:thioredoxin reductase
VTTAPIIPIIGGGPAGLSCALWLHNYGLAPLIIETEAALGGMARRDPYPNHWLLGRPGESGRENALAFIRHIEAVGVECWMGARPEHISRAPNGSLALEIAFFDHRPPRSISAPALVIATGTSFAGEDWLDRVRGARRLAAAGRVHLGPAWAGEPETDFGSHVAIIGGGDNAFDVARMLVEKGVQTTVVMRSKEPRAQPLLVEQLRQYQGSGRAQVLAGQVVEALAAAGTTVRMQLSGGRTLESDHVLLLFGYRPNSAGPWDQLAPAKDANGYLLVDGNMETSCADIFAMGDVANPRHPCIATAIASGTMAAREIQRRLASPPTHPAGKSAKATTYESHSPQSNHN